MTRYYIEPREEIYQRIWTFVIRGKSVQQIRKKLLDTATKTGLDTLLMYRFKKQFLYNKNITRLFVPSKLL